MSISLHRANLSSRPAAALIYRIFSSFPWLTHLSIDYAKCIFLNCQMLSLTHHLPIDYAGGSSKPQVISGTLSQRPSAAFLESPHSPPPPRQPQQDRSHISPTQSHFWQMVGIALQAAPFCFVTAAVPTTSAVVESTTVSTNYKFNRRLFVFLFTKKTATVGQIVRSGPYQCCSVHVNLQEGGSGNSKTRKKAETFHNSRSH